MLEKTSRQPLQKKNVTWPLNSYIAPYNSTGSESNYSWWNHNPPKTWPHLNPWNLWMWSYRRVSADVIKWRILMWDHLRLFKWALNPMTSVLIRERRKEDTEKRRRPCKDRGRGQSSAARSEQMPGVTGSWKMQERTLPWRLWREQGQVNILIPDFWVLKL